MPYIMASRVQSQHSEKIATLSSEIQLCMGELNMLQAQSRYTQSTQLHASKRTKNVNVSQLESARRVTPCVYIFALIQELGRRRMEYDRIEIARNAFRDVFGPLWAFHDHQSAINLTDRNTPLTGLNSSDDIDLISTAIEHIDQNIAPLITTTYPGLNTRLQEARHELTLLRAAIRPFAGQIR